MNIRNASKIWSENLKPRHDMGELDVKGKNILGHCGLEIQNV
jgi:hypothetical protein